MAGVACGLTLDLSAESVGGSPQSKHLIEDLIIESSKFPAAQPPDPNQPAKIETDYWPCPPSLAVVGRKAWEKEKRPRIPIHYSFLVP